MNQDKEKAILEITEDMVRQGGYNGFSFRNIADAVGIKSSSVHYHFATKEDLGVAVAEFYTERFLDALGQPELLVKEGKNPVVGYVGAFRNALAQDKGMCLCGMLGAEAEILPESVVNVTRLFFDKNVDWLERAYQALGIVEKSKAKALQTLSLLEGAMIISNTNNHCLDKFDLATELLIEDVSEGWL
jgi:TetR/AcrR family transcriptional repressor of nem operon